MEIKNNPSITPAIEPWLSVPDGPKAVNFYTTAFGAVEAYRMEAPDGGLVVKFTVAGAGFWISSDAGSQEAVTGNSNIKIILTTADPDALFAKALQAGATEVFPVGEDYGWRLGRLTDPFGNDWEIGRQL